MIPKFKLDASVVSEPLLTLVSRVALHIAHWAKLIMLEVNKSKIDISDILRLFIITILINNTD